MLIPRTPCTIGAGLPATEKPWKELLTDHEQSFLADNQLALFVDPANPGCARIHFYPLPFPHTFAHGVWDFGELVNHDSLRGIGPSLALTADETERTFQPHTITKRMRVGQARIDERCAVAGNTLAIRWEVQGLDEVALRFGLPYFSARVEALDGGLLVSLRDEVFVALVLRGGAATFSSQAEPFDCTARITLAEGRPLHLGLSCGYTREAVVAEAIAAAECPEDVFAAAEETWERHFCQAVPAFACSDEGLTRLYYYQAYVTRANLYDIPYEPFTRPYTCPWKTGAVWQWSWNTPMNAIAERWLNDKRIGAGGILLEGDNGGGLNIGTYLHPLRKITAMRGHTEAMQAVGAFRQHLPETFDLADYTTIPHTTPNGLLGAWEFFLCSGDLGFLRSALDVMLEAERAFSQHALPNGLYTCAFVDEFDYSLRLRPFIAAFRKGDPEMMLKMDTPFIGVDYNCYLYALRERILAAAALLPESGVDVPALSARNAALKEAINRYLWDPAEGFYYDADPRSMARSGVKCIAGFSALYAGIADRAQAARLVEHLANPQEFGTPFPCPSVAMDTPDVDPSVITYGGDSLVTSGIWFTIEGLVRYGYTALAAEYVRKTIAMVSQDGPSSSYSYHAMTGRYNQPKHTLAAQCGIVTDLIVKYIVGLRPQEGRAVALAPLALEGLDWLEFGPYRYGDRSVTVSWERNRGHTLRVEDTPPSA
ncbi:MAG: MGH1-like glycoside hydrolase domain-containing protein [Anaerolineae bacterium]